MKKSILLLVLSLFVSCSSMTAQKTSEKKIGFVIHGGAGAPAKGSITLVEEELYKAKLKEALTAGYDVLLKGGSSLDAVEAAVKILEDSPLFNAGKGAVFTAEGKNELDASIMNGNGQEAGAVAGLRHVKNPITLARAVMEKSPHVMMVTDGAEKFAKFQKIELVSEKYFWTQKRWDSLQEIKKEEMKKNKNTYYEIRRRSSNRFGTVGAVALDQAGNLAAGTSTGGMTYKQYGRVGDSPVIGAGTYAKNKVCGVSATGHGEYFIRLGVARDICALIEYKGVSLQQAEDELIHQKLQALGGDGGVIGLDASGKAAISFNSEGMFRAWIDEDGKAHVKIYE